MKKIISILLLVILMTCMMTACGAESLPVDKTVKVEFSGVNGYGTAHIEGAHDWLDYIELKEDMSELEKLGAYLAIEEAVDYKLSEKENLSNGDEVTLTITVNNEILKKYGFSAKDKTIKYKVEGLEVPKSYDAFDHVKVAVSGTAPYAKLNIQTTGDFLSGLTVKADKTENLSNGDKVTLTIETHNGEDLVAFCAQRGYAIKNTILEYTVQDVTQYITKFEEIPSEWVEKIKKQAEDVITTNFTKDRNGYDTNEKYSGITKLLKKEYVGHYVLNLKDGYTPSDGGWSKTYANYILVVYKLTATSSEGDFDYYYGVRFGDGKLVEGKNFNIDLTDYAITETEFTYGTYTYTGWGTSTYKQEFHGWKDLDVMYGKAIAPLVEKYTYETDIQQ